MIGFYDLRFGPVSFDFATWLTWARMQAASRDEPLHVVIVPDEDGLGGFARHWGGHDEAATRWRLWHIVLPLCQLGGATVTLAPDRAFAERLRDAEASTWWPSGKAHFMRPIVEAARAGVAVPRLKASEQARHYTADHDLGRTRRIVTLTLRNQPRDPSRNSDDKAWKAFADWLLGRGFAPVIISDADEALRAGAAWLAIADLDLRLALYERAHCNLIGHNGPTVLLWLSEVAPFVEMGCGLPAEPYRAHWETHLGLLPGGQLPWAGPKQRLVWQPDGFDALVAAFEAWEKAA